MIRLTEKRDGFYYDTDECMVSNCSQKLGPLEDLEEDIGMSLLTLFRILKLGEIICKVRPIENPKKTLLISRKIYDLYYDGCYYKLGLYEVGDDGYITNFDYVYIKDYGITWAIKKEELENDG